jgi:hypothetical protein
MKDLLAYYLLDRSGSMSTIWQETVSGLQSFVQQQAKAEGKAWISIAAFDNGSNYFGGWNSTSSSLTNLERRSNQFSGGYITAVEAYAAQDINVGEALESKGITPRGATPLLDSIVKAVREQERILAARPWFDGVVQLAIQTDGYENASTTYTYADVKDILTAKQEEGWEVLFMGAEIDAAAEGARLGIRLENTMQYDSATVASNYASYNTRTIASRSA